MYSTCKHYKGIPTHGTGYVHMFIGRGLFQNTTLVHSGGLALMALIFVTKSISSRKISHFIYKYIFISVSNDNRTGAAQNPYTSYVNAELNNKAKITLVITLSTKLWWCPLFNLLFTFILIMLNMFLKKSKTGVLFFCAFYGVFMQ